MATPWLRLDPDRRTLWWEGHETAHLTRQEFHLAELIIGCSGRCARWEFMAAALWPQDEPSDRVASIKVSLAKIRRKMRAAKMPDAFQSEVGLGFRLASKPA